MVKIDLKFLINQRFIQTRKSSSFDILELRRMSLSSHHTTIDLTDKENIYSTAGHSDGRNSYDAKKKVVLVLNSSKKNYGFNKFKIKV